MEIWRDIKGCEGLYQVSNDRKEIERKLKCFNVKKVIDGIYKQEKGYTFENV